MLGTVLLRMVCSATPGSQSDQRQRPCRGTMSSVCSWSSRSVLNPAMVKPLSRASGPFPPPMTRWPYRCTPHRAPPMNASAGRRRRGLYSHRSGKEVLNRLANLGPVGYLHHGPTDGGHSGRHGVVDDTARRSPGSILRHIHQRNDLGGRQIRCTESLSPAIWWDAAQRDVETEAGGTMTCADAPCAESRWSHGGCVRT